MPFLNESKMDTAKLCQRDWLLFNWETTWWKHSKRKMGFAYHISQPTTKVNMWESHYHIGLVWNESVITVRWTGIKNCVPFFQNPEYRFHSFFDHLNDRSFMEAASSEWHFEIRSKSHREKKWKTSWRAAFICVLMRAFRAPASNAKTADCSRTSDLIWLNKSPKLKDGQHLRRNSQVTLDTATKNFSSGQFKIRMKKVAAIVNFYLYLNAFLSPDLLGAWNVAHICPIKALLTDIITAFTRCLFKVICDQCSVIIYSFLLTVCPHKINNVGRESSRPHLWTTTLSSKTTVPQKK